MKAVVWHGPERMTVEEVPLPGAIDTPLLDQRPEPPSEEARAGMLRASDVAEVVAYHAGLSERVVIPELTVLPSRMRVLGATGAPNPFAS